MEMCNTCWMQIGVLAFVTLLVKVRDEVLMMMMMMMMRDV